MFFSRESKRLNDRCVKNYVLTLRMLMAAIVAIFIAAIVFQIARHPARRNVSEKFDRYGVALL